MMLKNRGVNFFVCDKWTKDLQNKTENADILISATGIPNLIKKEHLKQGAIVVDAGISMINGKVVGDVDFYDCYKKLRMITPVPGGIGPMTIAMLIENVLEAFVINSCR